MYEDLNNWLNYIDYKWSYGNVIIMFDVHDLKTKIKNKYLIEFFTFHNTLILDKNYKISLLFK